MAASFIARGLPVVIAQPGLLPKRTAFAWAHIEAVAQGHLLAMEKGQAGRSYFICGPVHTLEQAIEMASEITGIPAPRLRVAPGVLRATAAVMSVVEKMVPVPPDYTSEGLQVIAGRTYIGTNTRARQELGWNPRLLREGLTETLRHEQGLLTKYRGLR